MSYVFTIWVLGFAIPTLFIVVTSVVTCAKMQQVIQKSFLILLQKLILTIKYIIYIIPFYDISQFRNIIKSDVVRRMSFKRDQRAFRLVFAMNICYLLSWLPYGVLAFIHMFISKR